MMVFEDLEAILPQVAQWKSLGEKIVFTNGVFDILHIGHVHYLEEARKEGDRLIVGLNDDASVRRLNKGPERPINPQDARAGVLAALRCVDAVVIFGEDTPHRLITTIEPSVLVKGGDYDPSETDDSSKRFIVGSTEVRARGGSVVSIPLVAGFSTTGIVKKLRS
jgi:D-glycero-beta-D-manno-heptose 1-phosphate adenylyltransferase